MNGDIIEDTNAVFDACAIGLGVNLKEDYMYMYSQGDIHHFKSIQTRDYIAVLCERRKINECSRVNRSTTESRR